MDFQNEVNHSNLLFVSILIFCFFVLDPIYITDCTSMLRGNPINSQRFGESGGQNQGKIDKLSIFF